MNCIERLLRIVGRPSDGYGGVSEIARKLSINVAEPLKWRNRGWIGEGYAKGCSGLSGGSITEEEILAEARLGDKRRVKRGVL